jgi:hypothetical protein
MHYSFKADLLSYEQARKLGLATRRRRIILWWLAWFDSLVIKYSTPGKPGILIGAWCNGSTAAFGAVYSGSSPDAPVGS